MFCENKRHLYCIFFIRNLYPDEFTYCYYIQPVPGLSAGKEMIVLELQDVTFVHENSFMERNNTIFFSRCQYRLPY